MTTTKTRRAVLAGAAALPALAAPAALASISPEIPIFADADLIALGRRFELAWADQLRIESVYNQATNDDEDLGSDFEAAYIRVSTIVKDIENVPATTVAGLYVKARAISWCWGGDQHITFSDDQTTDVRLASSIVMDLLKQSIAVQS